MSVSSRASHAAVIAAAGLGLVTAFFSPVSTQTPPQSRRPVIINGREAADGEVLVKYRESTQARQADVESRADVAEAETFVTANVRRLRSRRLGTAALIQQLRQEPDIEYVEPNYLLRTMVLPNDTSFAALWGLYNTGSNTMGGGGIPGSDIDAPSAWNITVGSRANVVGVIDTGIDYTHPDLVANIWSAPAPFTVTIGGQQITCQAGTHGFNAIVRTCDPMDDQYHGTHVAGTIGASGNNGSGVAGVNWIASMMGLKFLGANGSGWTSDAMAAVEFALQAKAAFASSGGANVRILSNSWGGGAYSQAMFDTIVAAHASNMLFVASAGNSARDTDLGVQYPAGYNVPNVIAVAATDSSDRLASFSNWGATTVEMAAPGVGVHSTSPNNGYIGLSGTSMAAPHVSGAAALLLAMCSATTLELQWMLQTTVDVIPALEGKMTTGGRLNVARAMQACAHPLVTSVNMTANKPAPQPVGTTVTFSASASGGQAPYQYRWSVWDGASWVAITGWNSSNTFAWTPATANSSYQVRAAARSAWNAGAYEAFDTEAFAINAIATSVSVSSDKAAPQGTNTSITFTANATGGEAPHQYRWFLWDGTAWVGLTGWSTANTFTWTPPVANSSYQMRAAARSAWNAGAFEALGTVNFAINPAVTSVSVNANKTAPQRVNTSVTFTATAAGGQAPYQYRWFVWDGVAWTGMTGWSTGNTYIWTPTLGNAAYQVRAAARSAWNAGAYEALGTVSFAIDPPVTSVSVNANLTAPQPTGASITFTASASGGQSPYQYRWFVWNGTAWVALTGWSTSNVYTWTPVTPNPSYQVRAAARSTWNTGAYEAVGTVNFAIQ